jgi:hypothetical protein
MREVTRGWVAVLCAVLLVWRPLDLALTLPLALPSLGMRGSLGIAELVFQVAVAALAVAAVRALWSGMPSAPLLAAAALVGSAVATVQSLYWSVLPHQTVPSDRLPLASMAMALAAVWLVYLARSRRIREMRGH